VDLADLLEDDEEEKLQEQFTEIAKKYQCDVVVLTTDSCGGKTPQSYTEDYYEANDYGYGSDCSGIILMVSMGERKFHMTTEGSAIDAFTDYGLEQIDELITENLSDGEYYEAFRKFGKLADAFLAEAEEGTPYDVNNAYEEPMSIGMRVLIAAVAGLVIALIVILVLLGQLKSVGMKHEAKEYVRQGSFHVTRQRDIFLYRTVSKTRKERPREGGGGGGGSTIHTSSGGRSAGGHTGSF
jgi:uncharacterized protein